MLKLSDVIIKDVWKVSFFDLENGKLLANLVNNNNVEWVVDSPTTKVTGGRKTLALFSGVTASQLNIESATYDLNLLAMQMGDETVFEIANVPVNHEITIDGASTYKANLNYTPTDDCLITVRLDDGTVLVEGTVASETEFSVNSKALTFTAAYAGKRGEVFYETLATKEVAKMSLKTDSPIKYAKVVAELSCLNQCDKKNYMGVLIFPVGAVNKSFNMSSSDGDAASTHNITIEAVSSCNSKDLAELIIWGEDSFA